MVKRKDVPVVVQHSYAPDPNLEKVRAALAFWRQALAQKLAQYPHPEPSGAQAAQTGPQESRRSRARAKG